jgi:hypothetical protein
VQGALELSAISRQLSGVREAATNPYRSQPRHEQPTVEIHRRSLRVQGALELSAISRQLSGVREAATNPYRSQPRHEQPTVEIHRRSLRVQGVAPARRKVPETCRNGFWRTKRTSATKNGFWRIVNKERCLANK